MVLYFKCFTLLIFFAQRYLVSYASSSRTVFKFKGCKEHRGVLKDTDFETVDTCQVSLIFKVHWKTIMKQHPTVSQGQRSIQRCFITYHTLPTEPLVFTTCEVSWTSYKTIQMNSKLSQSLIKASKSFSIHKVCFHDRGLFKFQWIEQFTSTQCEYVSVCMCIFVCYCFWVSPELSWPLAQHVQRQTSPLLCSPHFHSSACLQLLCSSTASDEIFT